MIENAEENAPKAVTHLFKGQETNIFLTISLNFKGMST